MCVLPNLPKVPNMLHRHSLNCRAWFLLHGTLAPRTWPLSMPKAGRQVQSLDTEALPKFGKETRSLRRALSLCAMSYNADICGTWT